MSMMTSSPPPAAPKQVRSWKLLTMMTVSGAFAGLLIVTSYQVTLPQIEHHKAEVLRAAVQEVLKAPHSFDTLYLHNGALSGTQPQGLEAKGVERIYLGRDAAGKRIGFAISATENGFQDPVTVMFGYDAAAHRLIAMKVISNKETPGLGDKIEKDSVFVNDFVGAGVPLNGTKKGTAATRPNDIVMITGATISSRAVIRIINNAITRWQPLMDAYREETIP
jgi:Na+-translocating ferredoxin:NAD+ oxidoreductase subunit G